MRILNQNHVDFLLSEETMTEWAGRTMKERVVLFHRRFPNKRISLTALYRLYKANGVKRKAVKVNKTTPPPKVHN